MRVVRRLLWGGWVVSLWADPTNAEQVVISEIMYHPPDGQLEYVEIFNNTATPLDIARWQVRGAVDYDFPEFSAADPTRTFLKPFERVVMSPVDPQVLRAAYGIPGSIRIYGPWTGNLDNAGERITVRDKNDVGVVTVAYDDRWPWPEAADGAGPSLVLIDPDRRPDDWRNWTFSQRPGGTPGTAPVEEAETAIPDPEINLSQGIPYVTYGDTWKYHDQNLDLGVAWRQPGYNDSSWPEGPGLFGFETASLPAPGIQTPLADFNQLTYYLRKRFVYNGGTANVTLSVDQILDDGAVYYLNGVELGRVGVGGGTPTFATTASRTVSEAVEELNVLTTSGGALVSGENVLAVEVHQVNTTSSDVVFGARLKISVPSRPSLLINEVLPGSVGVGFVEFYNPGDTPIDLLNHYVSDDPANLDKFRIASSVVVPAGGLASVGFAEVGLAVANPVTIYLVEPDGQTAINGIQANVPLDGRSMGRKPTGSADWYLFVDPTRNVPNLSQSGLAGLVHLNEIHFSATNTVDWVELYNSGEGALGLEGLSLASRADLTDKVPLSGSVPALGQLSVNTAFPVSGDGEVTLYLVNAANAVLAGRRFERSILGPSIQAFPQGSHEYYGAATSTRDLPNAPARQTDIVINEIMYDPPSDEVSGEFIELFNRGGATVDLSRWRFDEGIDFTLPDGTLLPPGGYLVIAADEAWMRQTYGAIAVLGDFSGRLANGGERVRLVDAAGNLADQVDYLPGGNWPNLANGDGSSMELRNPWLENGLPSAWSDSNESNKAPFQRYTYSDVFRQLRADGGVADYKELHFHLVGDSHVVLNNVQVLLNGAGQNLILNGGQMSADCCSASGWLAQGTHWESHIENGQLHLIADGHGDNRANRVEIDVTGMTANQSYQVAFDARWVSGASRLVVQTWDHSIATSIALPVPANLGTPGSVNSTFIATIPPQVDQLLHQPAVPIPGETVRVTARVGSLAGGSEVRLFHRLDNNNGDGAWQSKLMFDNGFSGGDAVAGDGVFSAELTEYGSNGQIVQFYVRATSSGQTAFLPKWGADRPALYVVDTASAPGDLRRMRFVVSNFDLRTINDQDNPTGARGYAFPRLSNHYFNMTLIVNERDITYNCEVRNSGSPWTRGGGLSRGKFKLPKDRLFRGKEKLTFDNDAGGGARHHNRLARYWLYLLGHPGNENEYFILEVNNGGNNLREEVEAPANDMLDRLYANGSEGELYRIDDEWWFQDNWSRNQRNADWSYKGTDNAGRYRTEWMKRSRENDDDHSALIGLFRKINGAYTQAEIEQLVDPYDTMKMSAVRGYIHDWDSFSLDRGKNGYLYRRSTDGLFMFFHWDSDLAYDNASAAFYNGMPGFRPYLERTYNMRLFKHYLTVLVENFARNSAHMNAWIQAEEDSSSQYTVSTAYQTWFTNRETPARTFIGSTLLNTSFAITSNGGNPINTSAATINLAGSAPIRVFRVQAWGHPEGVFAWTSDTAWSLSGLQLWTGLNVLTIQALDEWGRVIQSAIINVNKSGNAPPVLDLAASPNSWRVSVIDALELDARDSFDPDGTPLTFQWSVTPSGTQLDSSQNDEASAVFPRPGLYTFHVSATDGGGATTAVQREAAVYAPDGFSPFNDTRLEDYWTPQNVVLRPHAPSASYYSVTEIEGHLVLQVFDNRSYPLGSAAPSYPFVWRALPARTDWAFLTKVDMRGIVFGDYHAGLMIETLEGGAARYAFGLEDGDKLTARRVSPQGTVSTLRSMAWTDREAVVRARRSGSSLHFEYELNDAWVPFHTAGLPVDTTALKAGLFLATDVAQRVKAGYDFALLVDPAATSDLRENLRISEIMYDPVGGGDFEYVELVNLGDAPLDLTGVQFTDGISYLFGSMLLAPRQHVVVAANPTAFASRYNIATVNLAPGAYSGRLDNDGETIELSDAQGVLILSVTYGVDGAWPSAANGQGNSLELINPTGNLSDPASWRASPEINGSPGRAGGDALGTVLIHEVLTHTDAPLEDAIELLNRTGQAIDIGGWFLSDDPSVPTKFRIPNPTSIGPGGFVVFYEEAFNSNNLVAPFSLSSARGDEVVLSAADGAGELTGYQTRVGFGPAANGVSFGQFETSQGHDFTALSARTFGADDAVVVEEFRLGAGLSNAAARIGPVVISELMYHPPDVGGTNDNVLEEFVEWHNITDQSVLLYDPAFSTNTWRLRGGIDYNLPAGLSIPARGYLVLVSFDPATNAAALASFRSVYSLPESVPILGPYEGKMDNGGETVRIVRPDTPQGPGPDAGLVPYIEVDELSYGDEWPWAPSADGLGDSLQRRRPIEYANDPVNWKGDLPTPGRANVPGSGFEDADHDGLPDNYELAHGFPEQDATNAGLDPDLDGRSNLEEFWDETNPTDGTDTLEAPRVAVQPMDRTVAAGVPVNFAVAALGTEPLFYQWWFNGVPIAAATNATLILSDTPASAAGEYQAVVWNAAGFDRSRFARLTVDQPLAILAQPLSRFADRDSDVTFNVFAVGTGLLNYQWQFEGMPLDGATNASLTLVAVDSADSGNYSVVVSDAHQSLSSASATLTVLSPPVILQQPTGRMVVAFEDVFLSVTAGGQGPFRYQWRVNGIPINAATNSVLALPNIQPNQSGAYTVEVFNPVSSVLSAEAVITILIPATITQQPVGAIVDPGASHTFQVAAFSSTPISYQWQFNDADIPGATGASLEMVNVQDEHTGNYRVVVTDGVGSIQSDIAVLIVLTAPVVVVPPLSQSVVVGGSVTFSIQTKGAFPMSYRWRRGFFTVTNEIISSHESYLTLRNVRTNDAGNYTVILTNQADYLPGVLSPIAQLVVLPDRDEDLMPDVWEERYNLQPDDPSDADVDADDDGMVNVDEYRSGTDPLDGSSCLKLESVARGQGTTIGFPAVSNQTYTLEYSDDLDLGLWNRMADLVAHATNRTVTVLDPRGGPKRFYRLITPRQSSVLD